jgi:hypothetical protein
MKHSFTFIKIGVLALLLVFANGVQAATDYGFKISTLSTYTSVSYGAWYQDSVTWNTNYVPLLGHTAKTGNSGSLSTAFHLIVSNIDSLTIDCTTENTGLKVRFNGKNSTSTDTISKYVQLISGKNTIKIKDNTSINKDLDTIINCYLYYDTSVDNTSDKTVTINKAYFNLTDGTKIPVMYSTHTNYVNVVNDFVVPSSDKPVTIFICKNYQGMQLYKGDSDSNTAATLSAGSTNLYNFELAEANSKLCFQTNTTDLKTNSIRYTLSTASFYQSVTASDADINYLSIRAYDSGLTGKAGSFDYVTIKGITVYEDFDNNVTYDEDNTNEISSPSSLAGVTINRTLTANNWAGIVLPYNLTNDEVSTCFGTGAKVATYGGVSVDTDGDVTFNFSTTTSDIAAGTPFLVYPTETIDTLPIKYTTLTSLITSSTESSGYTFTGTYDVTSLSAGSIYLAKDNVFKIADGTGKIKGFRAYFKSTTGSAKTFNLSIDGTVTGIEGISTDTTTSGNQKVYNLNGQYVGNSLEGLKSGVYISNGRKVIIK